MKLRTRLTLIFGLVFSALIVLLNLFIYFSFDEMRRGEFYLRLKEKSDITLRLLADVDDIDHEVLRIVDQNTVNAMYEEKTLVFGDDRNLIYSSLDNHPINYSDKLLETVVSEREVYFTDHKTHSEVYGTYRKMETGKSYIVLSSAYDRYGIEKLKELRTTLLFVSLFGIFIAVIIGYWIIYKGFNPLELLNKNIKSITAQNFGKDVQVPVKKGAKDEFSELADSYNQMLDRLADAFEKQKTFVQHASHELRTPVSAMMSEVELALDNEEDKESMRYRRLFQIRASLDKMSDLINSLLLLGKVEDLTPANFKPERVDEIVFSAAETVSERFPDFKPIVNFVGNEFSEKQLTIACHRYLLKILFGNLIENGHKYSEDGKVVVNIKAGDDGLSVEFVNSGTVIHSADRKKLFTPFFRSSNTSGKPGYGLGLSIAKRIAAYHNADLEYIVSEDGMNVFSVKFETE